jgi:hypothetical protein
VYGLWTKDYNVAFPQQPFPILMKIAVFILVEFVVLLAFIDSDYRPHLVIVNRRPQTWRRRNIGDRQLSVATGKGDWPLPLDSFGIREGVSYSGWFRNCLLDKGFDFLGSFRVGQRSPTLVYELLQIKHH